jgi:hypothetical protein
MNIMADTSTTDKEKLKLCEILTNRVYALEERKGDRHSIAISLRRSAEWIVRDPQTPTAADRSPEHETALDTRRPAWFGSVPPGGREGRSNATQFGFAAEAMDEALSAHRRRMRFYGQAAVNDRPGTRHT